MELKDVLVNRYTVRDYADTPVEEDKLREILEAGRVAPTAMNDQPQQIFVARSAEAIEKLNALSPCIYGAKTVLILTAGKPENPAQKQSFVRYNTVETDIAIVATHMMLRAYDLGVGSTWVGRCDMPGIHETFGLPEGKRVYGLLCLGYPGAQGMPSPRHAASKPIDELVSYL